MLKITIQSHRFNEPAVDWIVNALQYKQVPFTKKVMKKTDGVITVEIVKKENDGARHE